MREQMRDRLADESAEQREARLQQIRDHLADELYIRINLIIIIIIIAMLLWSSNLNQASHLSTLRLLLHVVNYTCVDWAQLP